MNLSRRAVLLGTASALALATPIWAQVPMTGAGKAAPSGPTNTMKIGMNTYYPPLHYSPSQAFLNIWKTAPFWQSTVSGATFYAGLDSDGWPTSLSGSSYARVNLLQGISAAVPTGRYVLLYDGTDGVSPLTATDDISINVANSVPGRLMLDMPTYTGAGIQIQLNSIGSPYVTNIRLVYSPDSTGPAETPANRVGVREALLVAGEIFDPTYITVMQPFKTLRFMDWLDTNDSYQVNWTDRPTQNWWSWMDQFKFNNAGSFGIVPYEVCIALCNKLSADLWLNFPPLATDDYISQLASLVLANLDSARHVYVESGNEYWNAVFGAFSSPLRANFIALGKQIYTGIGSDAGALIFGGMARQVQGGCIFKSVWSGSARVTSVLCDQEDGAITPLISHDGNSGIYPTVTVTTGNPTVINFTGTWPTTDAAPTGLIAGSPIGFTTTGSLPTGMSTNATYYVMAAGLNLAGGSFQISDTPGGSALVTSGSASGTTTANYWGGIVADIIEAGATAPYFPLSVYPAAWDNSPLGLTTAFNQLNLGNNGDSKCIPTSTGGRTTGGTSTAYTITTGQSLPSTPADCSMTSFTLHTTCGDNPTLTADGGTAFPLVVNWNTAITAGSRGPSDGSSGVYGAVFNGTLSVWELVYIYDGSNFVFNTNGDIAQALSYIATDYAAITGTYPSVRFLNYEGGLNFGSNSVSQLADLYQNMILDSRMVTTFGSYLSGLQTNGVKLFNHYSAIYTYNANGFFWGALDDMWETDYATVPRYKAMVDFITS